MTTKMSVHKMALCVIACVLSVFILQIPAVPAQGAEISFILNKQTPYPVEPGQVVNVEVAIQNGGTGSDSITLEILPKAPFTLLSGQETVKTFSRVAAYDTVTQSYKLRVAETAVSASYDLEFRYYRQATGAAVTKKLPILVQGTPKIVIEEIRTLPENIQPGDEVEISIKFKNEGTGEASQTELSLESETTATTGNPIIMPVLSGGIFYLGKFSPGEERTAEFRLKIDNDAEYKTYLSTLSINYKDENGGLQSVSYQIGVPVTGRPLITILNTEMDGGNFKVEINNIGTARAKGMKISLIQGGQTKGVSVVSEIKAGKYKAVRFSDYVFGEGMLNISYYDEANVLHYGLSEVYINKPSSDQTGNDYSSVAMVLGIVVVLETFYLWRLRRKKK